MKLFLAGLLLANLSLVLPAAAEEQVQQILYNVDAAEQCSLAAADQGDLRRGLEACNTVLSDPAMFHRAALLVDRGVVIAVRLGEDPGGAGRL